MTRTSIEWTDRTWNPIRGCSVISPGCVNCYAMKQAHRFSGAGTDRATSAPHKHGEDRARKVKAAPYAGLTKMTKAGPQWTGAIRFVEEHLTDPLRWSQPQRIFVNSMSDLFHEALADETIDRVFAVMALAHQHTFQILTKRPQRMREWFEWNGRDAVEATTHYPQFDQWRRSMTLSPWPLPNVWLGVSVEDQKHADERIPLLLETPAAVRFVSAEPLLGPIDFTLSGSRIPGWDEDWRYDVLTGEEWAGPRDDKPERSQHLDWVIVGGESGSGARPMHPYWPRQIRDACLRAGVPFFFKQWGEWTPGVNVERRRGTVETATWFDSRWVFGREDLASDDGHVDDEPDLYRVGKATAGRRLEGREWNDMPEASA